MKNTNKMFSNEEIEILKKAKNSDLRSIDIVIVAPPYGGWNKIRLHFDGFSIDIINSLGEIVVDEFGTLEEFGLMSIEESTSEKLEMPEVSSDTTTIEINKVISGIDVFNDVIDVYGNGVIVATIKYPQAISFLTDGESIMIDKEVWFSEMLNLKIGRKGESIIYDDSINWEDNPEEDPDTHFEFKTETIRI